MSRVAATIDEKLVNAILGRVLLSGSEHREGPKIPIPLAPDPPLWSVTLNYRVDCFHAEIEEGAIRYRARVHGDAMGFSYTDDVEGSMAVEMRGTTVVVRPQSLKVTLYIQPMGKRINILDFDIVDRLPSEAKTIQIELFREHLRIPVPGGGEVSLAVLNPQIRLRKDAIEVSADVDVA